MGQIPMEKPELPGSVLSGNQHPAHQITRIKKTRLGEHSPGLFLRRASAESSEIILTNHSCFNFHYHLSSREFKILILFMFRGDGNAFGSCHQPSSADPSGTINISDDDAPVTLAAPYLSSEWMLPLALVRLANDT